MRQVLFKDGAPRLEEVPTPIPGPREVLVRVAYSCVSTGTERSVLAGSMREGLFGAVTRKPRKVLKAVDMARKEGVETTLLKIRGDLDLGAVSGYTLSGEVVAAGSEVRTFQVGQRVACAGNINAFHAEYVTVPESLVLPVPADLGMEAASTVALGAVAMHGLRRASIALGERVAIIGLGALGQLTGLLARHAGCVVAGFDIEPARLEEARALGFDVLADAGGPHPEQAIVDLTDGHGVDHVLITASSRNPVVLSLAARLSRRKGNVIMVGDVALELNRTEWYPGELDLLMSTSYGPGRYDPEYEQGCLDYPYAYVRWTEGRNMAAYLECLTRGVDISPLIASVFDLDAAQEAYAALGKPGTSPLVLLRYPAAAAMERAVPVQRPVTRWTPRPGAGRLGVAVMGPGSFALDVHLPNLGKLRDTYKLRAIVARGGHNAKAVAVRFGADYAASDFDKILADPEVQLVMITTRHDTHADLAIRAARAGKAVFVEKPAAVDYAQLDELAQVLEQTGVPYMLGFNRRFSPFAQQIRRELAERRGPAMLAYRVNQPPAPPEAWFHGPEGGGRVVGEGCHFLDLMRYLADSPVVEHWAAGVPGPGREMPLDASFQMSMRHADGSLSSLTYASLGDSGLPKERLEVFSGGRSMVLDNFTRLTGYGTSWKTVEPGGMRKGYLTELELLAKYLNGKGPAPIPLHEILDITRLTLDARAEILGQRPVAGSGAEDA